MIEKATILSLVITTIYVLFQQGMFLGWLRIFIANVLDRICGLRISKYIQKPIWDCLPCMAGIWTIILTLSFDLKLIFIVCGINVLIEKFLDYDGNNSGAKEMD